MSTKISIKKVILFVMSIIMVAVGFASCSRLNNKGVVKTETWEGNQTLDKVLDTIAEAQEGGKNQSVFSIDGRFEAHAGDQSFSLKVQASFDLENSLNDELLIELTDMTTYALIGGIYAKGQKVYIQSGDFKFTVSELDILSAIGDGVSGFFKTDIGDALGSIDIGMDITAILGGFLFPSASVVTESPRRGENGSTVVTINADMDIDTVLSVVLGALSLVNDIVGDAAQVDLNAMLKEFTGTPLLSTFEMVYDEELGKEVEVISERGYDDIFAEIIGVKDGGTPFAGSTLYMKLVDGVLLDAEVKGKYQKPGEEASTFGFRIAQLEVKAETLDIDLPEFVNTFDIYSVRLQGYGNIPDVGDIEIKIDVRLDPNVAERNQIVFEVVKRYSRELVLAGYYKDGYIYLDLSSVDISYIHLDAVKMGVGKIRIDGVNLQQIMKDLIGDLGFLAGGVTPESELSSAATYSLGVAEDGSPALNVDTDYLLSVLIGAIGAADGRIYLDLTSEVIADLLDSLGVEVMLDDMGQEIVSGGEYADIFNIVKDALGYDVEQLLNELGKTVIDFVVGLDVDIKLSAFLSTEDLDGPGVGVDINVKGEDWAYVDLRILSYGDGYVDYDFPSDLSEYKPFDYSTISFSGTANITNIGPVTYDFVVSNLTDIENLTVSWTAYDNNGVALMSIRLSDNVIYINLGDQTRLLGFKLSELNVNKIQISLDELLGDSTASAYSALSADEE
ncbi:MAG: hypothetical protein LBQ27_01305, partial [Clostridiales bacterium]|nr:hypothetical protein [Clostridiales bacterium]